MIKDVTYLELRSPAYLLQKVWIGRECRS